MASRFLIVAGSLLLDGGAGGGESERTTRPSKLHRRRRLQGPAPLLRTRPRFRPRSRMEKSSSWTVRCDPRRASVTPSTTLATSSKGRFVLWARPSARPARRRALSFRFFGRSRRTTTDPSARTTTRRGRARAASLGGRPRERLARERARHPNDRAYWCVAQGPRAVGSRSLRDGAGRADGQVRQRARRRAAAAG